MKKTGLAAALVLAMVIAGCGTKDAEGGQDSNKVDQPPAVEATVDRPDAVQAEEEVVESEAAEQVEGEAEPAEDEVVSSDEAEPTIEIAGEIKSKEIDKMVLDHVNIFMSGNDEEAKLKHIEENMHPQIAGLFKMTASEPVNEADAYKNPKVIKTIKLEDEGDTTLKDSMLTLVEAADGKEIIVFMAEGKILLTMANDNDSEERNEDFANAKSHFK